MGKKIEKSSELWSIRITPSVKKNFEDKIRLLRIDKAGATLVAIYYYLGLPEEVRRSINTDFDNFIESGCTKIEHKQHIISISEDEISKIAQELQRELDKAKKKKMGRGGRSAG